jgi:hypothetical protein
MRFRAPTLLFLCACSASHTIPYPPDAAPPAGDAGPPDARPSGDDGGSQTDAGPPSIPSCDEGLVEERGRCVGWRPAAALPFEYGFWIAETEEVPLEVVRAMSSGELLVRHGEALYRYVRDEDRFEDVAPTAVVQVDAPPHALPEDAGTQFGRALGWLDDGTFVIAHVTLWSGQWIAERDDGDGTWQPTVQPDFPFEPALAIPLDERSILFAGRSSGIYVIQSPVGAY